MPIDIINTSDDIESLILSYIIFISKQSNQMIEEFIMDNSSYIIKLNILKSIIYNFFFDEKPNHLQIAENLLIKLHKDLSSQEIKFIISDFREAVPSC